MLAVDPLPGAVEVENHAEAVARWAAQGVAGATLLLVDVVPGTRLLGPAQEAAVADLRRTRAAGSPPPPAAEIARRLAPLESASVTAAAAIGIVREVVWLTPFDYFHGPEKAAVLPADLKDAGLSDEEIRAFALRDGCFRGTAGGIPLAVCGLEALPRLAEPILLCIDTEFVLEAAEAGTNPVAEIHRTLSALATARYSVLDAVLVASVVNSGVPPDLRWVGETIVEMLQDPSGIGKADRPKRAQQLLKIAMELLPGKYSDMLHRLWPFLALHENDPALHLYAAMGQMGLGKPEESLERAENACRLDPGYCYGLPRLGLRLMLAGDVDGGERFFAAAELLLPAMRYRQFDRGLLLLAAGRRERAFAVFRTQTDLGNAFPHGFLAGALALERGDRTSALRLFDLALEAFRIDSEGAADHPETFRAIRAAALLYREEGAAGKAEMLEGNPRLLPPGEGLGAPAAP